MAEIKISALGSATSLTGTEAVPVVQGGVTKRVQAIEIANLLQPAVDVISQALSVEQDSRNADITRLSDILSNVISAGGGALSVTSNELSAVSALAELHLNALSLTVENEISERKSAISAPSARTSLGASVHGLQSIVDAISDRISGVVAGANSVTSNALSVVYATLSNRTSAVSAVASSADQHASAASDAATSANIHANAASAAATSVDNHVNLLSIVVSNLNSAHNALSNVVSGLGAGGASVTSTDLSAAIAVSVQSAGTSVKGLQSVVNTLSDKISAIVAGTNSVTSTKLSAHSAANTLSIQTASAAATSVLNYICAVSARTTAGASVKGLQSIVEAFSNRISAAGTTGGATSVTSTKLSAAVGVSVRSAATSVKGLQSVANTLSARIAAIGGTGSVTSNKLSLVSANAAQSISVLSVGLVNEINNRISSNDVLSFRISVVSNALSIETAARIAAIDSFSNLLSAAALNTASALSTISNQVSIVGALVSNLTSAHNVLSNRVSANSATGGGGSGSVTSNKLSAAVSALNKVSARSLPVATTSVQGLQSAINALSYRISVVAAGGPTVSVTSTKLSNVISAVNTLSLHVDSLSDSISVVSNVVSLRGVSIAVLSQALSVVSVHVEAASAAATSADAHANAASAAATSVGNVLNTLSVAVSNLTSAHNALSGVVANALSAGDVISAGIGHPQLRMLSGGIATISASGLTKISGLSVSVALNGIYQIKGVILHTHSTAATNGFGFGVSSPAASNAGGVWRGFVSVAAPGAATENVGYFNQDGFGSITYSATPTASATTYRTELDLLLVSVAAGNVKLKARTSAAAAGAIHIQVGSYVQAFKIG